MFEHVKDAVSREGEKDSTEPVCLVIDSLSVLLSVGVALSDVVVLVQQCVRHLASPEGPCKVHHTPLRACSLICVEVHR